MIGMYFIDILYDKSGREIGRSCLQKEKKIAVTVPGPEPEADTAVPADTNGAPPSKEERFKWWWFLFLLLIPLLWILLRGC